jgi:hypothetical protein
MAEDKASTINTNETTDDPSRPAKQSKTMLPQAPPNEWPKAWLMPDGECENQKALNQREPNVAVSVEELQELGIK